MLIWIAIGCIAFTVAVTLWGAFHGSRIGGQSMRESVLESWANIGIGFSINYAANMTILPMAGAPLSAADAFWVGCIFTAISIARSLWLRRAFNKRTVRHGK